MSDQLPITITGRVVRGAGRGRSLGFPTANLDVGLPASLAFGIYAGWATVDGERLPAVIYWGNRPTFNGQRPTCEVHLLDGATDRYGQRLSVDLVTFIRPDQRFDSPEALRRAIQHDTKLARLQLCQQSDA